MTFKTWLEDQGYQPSTVASTLRMVHRAKNIWTGGGDTETYRQDLRRFATYLKDAEGLQGLPSAPRTADKVFEDKFTLWVRENYEILEPKPTGATQEGKALSKEEWTGLVRELAEDSPINRVVRLLIGLPYPAQELRVTLEEPLAELKKQLPPPYLSTWKKIAASGAGNMQAYLAGTNTYDAAYKRIQRRLVSIGESIERPLNLRDIGATGWELRFAAALEAP